MSTITKGKYTFQIQEHLSSYEGQIIFNSIKIGGNYQDCATIIIHYQNNQPNKASMPHILYDEECSLNTKLDKGDGSKQMLNALFEYVKQNYPSIKEIEYDDMSSVECADETEQLSNTKKGNILKPIPLYYLSIVYNGLTWYEKYFNAKMKNQVKYNQYKARVNDFLHDANKKPKQFIDFYRNISPIPDYIRDDLVEHYNTSNNFADFFKSIPKSERCKLLRPWLERYMSSYFGKTFSNTGWIIPLHPTTSTTLGGKKTRKNKNVKQITKSNSFYIPKQIIRNPQHKYYGE